MRHATVILLIVTSLALFSACTAAPRHRTTNAAARPAVINHVVLFKLKNSNDASELIQDCDRDLSGIPGIVSYYAGKRLDIGRPHVETNFDVGFYVGFQNQTDYAAYLSHPKHVAAVAKWNPRCESIRIQDVIDETP